LEQFEKNERSYIHEGFEVQQELREWFGDLRYTHVLSAHASEEIEMPPES
jgi:hypothetical protein